MYSTALSSGYREFWVSHLTEYSYEGIVDRSSHLFRLHPIEDFRQKVLSFSLTVSVNGESRKFQDVFGNCCTRYAINSPYQELSILSTSHVAVNCYKPDETQLLEKHESFPLVWMPWQQQMMMPYLLPAELPETQLEELKNYAMSFAIKNNYLLLHTIDDMNLGIYNDFEYKQGVTSVHSTPYEIFISRQGVCQDFANLFICLARLLGIPARYRMGYIYTDNQHTNQVQSEASHAWVELYLPNIGWRGFDPTNACVAGDNHVRVACGRQYQDTAPTSGTLYHKGAIESMQVKVKIKDAQDMT